MLKKYAEIPKQINSKQINPTELEHGKLHFPTFNTEVSSFRSSVNSMEIVPIIGSSNPDIDLIQERNHLTLNKNKFDFLD